MASPALPVPLIAGAIGGLSVFLLFNAQGASVGTSLPAAAIVGLVAYYFASVVGQQPNLQPTEAVKPKKKTKQEKQKQKSVPSSSSSSASAAASDDDADEQSSPSSSSKKKDKKAKKAAAAAAAAAVEAEENQSEASEASETSEGDDEDDSGASLSKNAKKKAKKKAKELAAKKEEEKKAAAAAAAAASANKKSTAKKEDKKAQPAPAPTPAPAPKKDKKPAKEAAPTPAAQPAAALAPPQEEEAFQQSKSDKKKNKKDEKAKKREEAKQTQSVAETPKSPTPVSPSVVAPSKKQEAKAHTAVPLAAPVSLSPSPIAAEFEEGEWNIAKAGKPTSAQKKEIKAAESKAAESLSSSSKSSEPADYVDIPVSKIPAIIGTKGAVLKALQEGTGATIEVPKAAERDLQSLNARILIRGDPEQVKNAKICVKSLAEKGFSYITHPGFVSDDIYVESRQHGLVIGPKGATLKTIQTKSGTFIRMPDKGGNDRILIVGPKEGVKNAKDAIKQLVQDGFSTLTHDGYDKKEIDFPSAKLGILIGPGGQTIKSIQGNTNTQIKIPARDADNQKVVVFGPAARLAQAEKEILKLLEPKVKKSNKADDGKDEEDAEAPAAGEDAASPDAANGEAAPQSAFDAWAAAEVQQTSEDAMWGATQ